MTLLFRAVLPLGMAAQPASFIVVRAPQSITARIAGGPFDQIAQWFRDRASEVKQEIARWKTIDLGDALAKSFESMFSGVGNLGKGIQKQMEKSLPGQ